MGAGEEMMMQMAVPAPTQSDACDWSPFLVLPRDERAPAPRSVNTREGVGDRLRAAAFAEIQAARAFAWAAERFEDAPMVLRQNWRGLALAEERHLGWLLKRMEELAIDVRERGVSDWLWDSLIGCGSAKEFAVYMASAEERGRRAGVRFYEAMLKHDPVSAEIFGKIAEEEVEHIRLAERFFPEETRAQVLGNSSIEATSSKRVTETHL